MTTYNRDKALELVRMTSYWRHGDLLPIAAQLAAAVAEIDRLTGEPPTPSLPAP